MARKTRGRPPAARIELLVALGWSAGRIAGAVGMPPAELRARYRAQLSDPSAAQDKLDAEILSMIKRKAQAGCLAAIDMLRELLGLAARAQPSGIGKKARLDTAARTPVGSWADVLPPVPAGGDTDDGDDDGAGPSGV